MAYIDRSTGNSRAYVITAVAALHGAAFYALITGLGVEYIKTQAERIKLIEFPVEQPKMDPPKPAPPETARPLERPVVAPPPIVVLPNTNNPIDTVPTPLPTFVAPVAPATAFVEPIPPKPTPSFAPRGARAIGKPDNWVTPNDYPARDLREGNQGRTSFALTIGADGKVQSCRITQSSGFAGLDAATCEKVTRRARFEPARDGDGAATIGSYASTVAWRIPE